MILSLNHDMFGSCPEKTNNNQDFPWQKKGIPAGFFLLDRGEQLRFRTWWKITRSLARRFGSLSLPARIKTTTCTLESYFPCPEQREKGGEMVFVHETDPPKDKRVTCVIYSYWYIFFGGGKAMFYAFYHGKSPCFNHHLGWYFGFFPSIFSKSK